MHKSTPLSRRTALKLGAAGAVGAAMGGAAHAGDAPTTSADRGEGASAPGAGAKPRNIIFMVSDGMSLGVPSLAERFSMAVREKPSVWWKLARDADTVHGQFDTSSLNDAVTDSAAACCAWATGSRIQNGLMNLLPDGTPLKPIGTLAHEAGRRLGLVTTTHVTHATPAGFVAVSRSRGDYVGIAPQYLNIVDVLMGGGTRFFQAENRHDRRDLAKAYQDAGYQLMSHRDQVINAPAVPDKILGLFAEGHLPYTIDQREDPALRAQVPTLAEMTDLALRSLAQGSRGFLLQVEGGRVDHAAHNTDAAALLWDQLAFEDAVERAVAFARERGDTMVVVTTDHGNANPGLHGAGIRGMSNWRAFERLGKFKASFPVLWQRLVDAAQNRDDDTDHTPLAQQLQAMTGLSLDAGELTIIANALQGNRPPELNRRLSNIVGMLGQIFGNHTGVQFVGTQHTQDFAPILAIGPGAQRFHGLMPNTDAFVHLTALMDIDHTNPAAEAQAHHLDAAPLPTTAMHPEPADMHA